MAKFRKKPAEVEALAISKEVNDVAKLLGGAFFKTASFIGTLAGLINKTKTDLSGTTPRRYKLVNKKTKRRRIDVHMRLICGETKLFKYKGN